MRWTKIIIEKDGFPVKVYVNHDDTHAVVFPLFGKYFTVSSDRSALDLFVMILFHTPSESNENTGIVNFGQYQRSSEDTAIINQESEQEAA